MWGIGIGLLIILCHNGYNKNSTIILIEKYLGRGYLVNSFLTAKPWNIIAKLSYCIYIFHYMIVIIWEQSWKSSFYADYWSLGHR